MNEIALSAAFLFFGLVWFAFGRYLRRKRLAGIAITWLLILIWSPSVLADPLTPDYDEITIATATYDFGLPAPSTVDLSVSVATPYIIVSGACDTAGSEPAFIINRQDSLNEFRVRKSGDIDLIAAGVESITLIRHSNVTVSGGACFLAEVNVTFASDSGVTGVEWQGSCPGNPPTPCAGGIPSTWNYPDGKTLRTQLDGFVDYFRCTVTCTGHDIGYLFTPINSNSLLPQRSANLTIKDCDIGQLQSPSVCASDLGALSGATVTMSAPANGLTYGTGVTTSSGQINFTWYIPSGQNGVLVAFRLNKTGYNTQEYLFLLTANTTKTLYLDRALGFTFYGFEVRQCNDPSLGNSGCLDDNGPVPQATYNVSGPQYFNGTTDVNGRFALALNQTGAYIASISKTGYQTVARAFQNPATTTDYTIYLAIPAVTCSPNPGNFTVPAQASISVTAFIPNVYYTFFQIQPNGLPGFASQTFQFTQTAGGSGVTSTIVYPIGRASSLTIPPANDTGSYLAAFADSKGSAFLACPFILYSGSGAAPLQATTDPATLNLLTQALQTPVNQLRQADKAASQTETAQDLILSATAFAFDDPLILPNLFVFLIACMIIGIIMASARRS